MPIVWTLWSLATGQALCWLVARGLGRRLERHAVALGLLLPLLVLAPWLQSSRLLFPGDFLRHIIPGAPELPGSDRHQLLNDPVFLFIPWALEVRHALRAGRLPFWSDLLEGGSSPWLNPQAGVLAPLANVTRVVPIQYWLLAMLAVQIQLAFEGTWLLARALAIRRLPSLLAAAGFSLGGGVMSWALYPVSATPRDTVVATSLQLPAGWSARSGGRPLRKLVVNGAFLGLRIPRGEHRIELRFVPPGFAAGAALGGLALLTCGALLLWPARQLGPGEPFRDVRR